jgi:CO/xanthine dehydrogenase FAD-binding subunit
MIISMAGLCLVVDEDQRAVRVALGSVAPTVVRARDAEAFISEVLGRTGIWDDPAADLDPAIGREFAERVAMAGTPIDDVRGTAAYRRHACRVLAGRALSWALSDRTGP